MNERETSQSVERVVSRNSEERRKTEIALDASAAVELLAKRHGELLAAVEKYLPSALLERLRAKAILERELLSQSFEREQQVIETAKKAVHVLNKTFFRITRMEPHIFD